MNTRFQVRGVTLIELIAFIIIVGILVAGIIGGFSATLRGSGMPRQMTQAQQLAQERMELIRARKDALSAMGYNGFACFTGTRYDPCQAAAATGSCPAMAPSGHPACSATPGYTVTPLLDETGACIGNDPNYKCITVTTTDSASGSTLAQLQAAVANY